MLLRREPLARRGVDHAERPNRLPFEQDRDARVEADMRRADNEGVLAPARISRSVRHDDNFVQLNRVRTEGCLPWGRARADPNLCERDLLRAIDQ